MTSPTREIRLHAKTTEDGRGLLEAARDLERTAQGVDKLGGKMKATAEDSKRLGRHIEDTRKRVEDLRRQIARTGDTSLFRNLGQEEAKLRRLQRLASNLTPGGGGGGLLGAIPAIGGVPGPVVAGGAAAATALAPAISATIAAAVLGGVGTGGLIGGVALATQDSRVKSAFKDLGKTMFTELSDASAPFVAPLVKAASSFGQAWREELPAFAKDFKVLSEAVEPITHSLTGFIHELHPGLSAAFRASIPLAHQFDAEMGRFGGAMSDFLQSMADSAPGAKSALHDLFTVTDEGLRQLGDNIEVLTGTYDAFRKLGMVAPPEFLLQMSKGTFASYVDVLGRARQSYSVLVDGQHAYVRSLPAAAAATEKLKREQEKQTEATEAQRRATERNTKAIDDYFDTVMGRLDASEHYQAALDDLTESVRENGKTLDITTEQGRANQAALKNLARATKEMYDAGLLTDQAYQQQIRSIELMAVKLGLSKDAVHDLIAAFEKLPSQVITSFVGKVDAAFAQVLDFLDFGGKTPVVHPQQGRGGTDFSVTPVVSSYSGHQAFIDLPGRAAGGPVGAGQSYLIGEKGVPEVLTMGSSSGYVSPIGGTTTVTINLSGGDDDLIRWLRKRIRIEGGTGSNSVQVALGQ